MKTFLKQNRGGRSRNPESSIQNLVPHERGVALVITLILLSVITFMAVTFLVVTRSEKGSVNSDFDQATAKTIAQEGVEQAKMQIFAQMLAYTNPSVVNLLVSTNYELSSGFINTGPAYTWFTNVSYHYPNGLPVSGVDALQNLMNQRYLPSPPVFVTNRSAANSNDFRSYLDVNRNGRFEPTGLLPVISTNPGLPFINATNGTLMATPVAGATLSNVMVGDPQWVGVLDRPTFPLDPETPPRFVPI